MINNLSIPTVAGVSVALASFSVAMFGLVSQDFTWQGYQIFWLSLILGPTAMVSSMFGYAAWWLSKFLATLLSNQDTAGSDKTNRDSNN
ncbi:MAG: hypothetical protein WCP72_06600 [Desulfomonile sp.]|jgi:hypothetical protein